MDPKKKIELILGKKRESIERLKAETSYNALAARSERVPEPRGFGRSLMQKKPLAVIAEVKKASPSKGIIREDFNPMDIALQYEKSGASAISVLTEEHFFLGSPKYLQEVHRAVSIPVLRKDFLLDPIQIPEARALGADAVLLIAAFLEKGKLRMLLEASSDFGLDALVEVHSESELEDAMKSGARIIGINNRNLKTFHVDFETTFKLLPSLRRTSEQPSDGGTIVVSESGISNHEQVTRLSEAGVDAILVGESLMRSDDIGGKLQTLLHGPR